MRTLTTVLFTVIAAGCTPATDTSERQQDISSTARAYPLATFPSGFEADDVTGDERLVFTGVLPSLSVAPAVVVASRITGAPVGTLPPPPSGFILPTCVKVVSYSTLGGRTSGELLVIDNAGLPPTARPIAYRYHYSYAPMAGFSATLVGALPLPVLTTTPPSPPNGVGYASGLLVLDPSTFIITDALSGGAWVCNSSFTCQLGIVSPDLAPGAAAPFSGVGRAPSGGERPYTFVLPTPIFPGAFGAAYVAKTDEVCVERAAAPGGLWCIARTTLLDLATSPLAKTKRVVVPPTAGVSDAGHGIAADRFHPASPWLYWARSFDNTVRRVNVETLQVEVVAHSTQLFDFPTGLDVLPPLVAGSPLTTLGVAMGQEENNALLNTALGGTDAFVAPTLISAVLLPAL